MQYITTRTNTVIYDSICTLCNNSAEGSGLYIPLEFPRYNAKDILALQDKSFGQNIADVLNLFYDTDLTGWDVDFCIGRSTARTTSLGNKLLLAELWHNPAGELDYIITRLYKAVCKENTLDSPSEWFLISVRVAILFAVYGEMKKQGAVNGPGVVDFSVSGKELKAAIAAIYARKMGLPVGMIIITDSQNKMFWNLIHRGELYFSHQSVALSDGIERVLYEMLGSQAVYNLLNANQQRRGYFLNEEELTLFNEGIFCNITSADRVKQTLNSIYRTNNYILDPDAAMCIGGLQDYRAKTGEHKQTVVISEKSPKIFVDNISDATGLTRQKIEELVNLF